MQLATKLKTPDEIRRDFERMKKRVEDKKVDNLNTQAVLCTAISLADLREPLRGGWVPSLRSVGLSQSLHAVITESTTATVGGCVREFNGCGLFSGGVSVRHALSESTQMFGTVAMIGHHQEYQVGVAKKLSEQVSSDMRLSLGEHGLSALVTAEKELDRLTRGGMTVRLGAMPNAIAHLTHTGEDFLVRGEVKMDTADVWAAVTLARKFNKRSELRLTGSAGTDGRATVSLGCSRAVTKSTRFAASVDVHYPSSLNLTLAVERSSQRIALPILLTPSLSLKAVLGAFTIPIILTAMLKKLVIDPRKRRRRQRYCLSHYLPP
jgi:hypothetical protein